MSCMKYNVVMPVVYKDYSFLQKTLKYVFANLCPEQVFIITDKRYEKLLPKNVLNNCRCSIIDENELVDGMSYAYIESILKSQGREHTKTGWYFQQFLKMGFANSNFCDLDYYLSWDSDTIPVNKIDFFDVNEHPFFTMKVEHHQPYFDTIRKLLGIDNFNSHSYISEHMMFNKIIMKELLSIIADNNNIQGKLWFEKILNSICPETISPFSFSEFETYGTYCMNKYPDFYLERNLPGFRQGGLIQGRFVSDSILRKLGFDVSVVSFEIYDRPPFPWSFICGLYEEYLDLKRKLVKRYIS